MSHYLAAVVVPARTTRIDAEEYVRSALAPWSEEVREDGFWDWWQIGGRWTGIYSGFDPSTAPENIEECWLCRGSGVRPDGRSAGGCNGCDGQGRRAKWPSSWAAHDGDVQPVASLLRPSSRMPFTLVVPDVTIMHKEVWNGVAWIPDASDEDMRVMLARMPSAWFAVVDYHS